MAPNAERREQKSRKPAPHSPNPRGASGAVTDLAIFGVVVGVLYAGFKGALVRARKKLRERRSDGV